MKKKVLLLFITGLTISLMVSCGASSGSGGGKYPAMNKTLTQVLSIVKANKDNPEEAKKQVKELMSKNADSFKKEAEAFTKSLKPKIEDFQKKMKEKMKGKSPAEMMKMAKSMQEEGMKVMADELPVMSELMKVGMDPKYQKVMQAIGSEMKDLKLGQPQR